MPPAGAAVCAAGAAAYDGRRVAAAGSYTARDCGAYGGCAAGCCGGARAAGCGGVNSTMEAAAWEGLWYCGGGGGARPASGAGCVCAPATYSMRPAKAHLEPLMFSNGLWLPLGAPVMIWTEESAAVILVPLLLNPTPSGSRVCT